MVKKVLLVLLLSPCFYASGQSLKERWVDSVFQRLSPEQKVGQLFMLPVSTLLPGDEMSTWIEKVKSYHPGGILITHGGPISHAQLVNKLQGLVNVPLLIGINAEWGLAQTLDSTFSFHKPLTLSAVPDTLITATAREIGRQMRLLGIHINFAPNADKDLKEEVYPISQYYFSDQQQHVARKAIAFAEGLRQEGVMACAKHYPNEAKDKMLSRLGSKRKKDTDSTLYFNIDKLDTNALYTYRRLFEKGLPAVLTTNLHFSSLDKRNPVPVSISQLFIGDVLKRRLGFKGLTFTNIPYLEKISRKPRAGETELLAFTLGKDVLIDPQNLSAATRKILREVKKNKALQAQLDASVKKILSAKYDAGLHQRVAINTDNLVARLNSVQAKLVREKVASRAVTVLKNQSRTLPITTLDNKRFASVVVGKEEQNTFNTYLRKYAPFESYTVRTYEDTVALAGKLRASDVVVVSVFPLASRLEKDVVDLLKKLPSEKQVIVCHFADPLSLPQYQSFNALLSAYADEDDLQRMTAQVIFGAAQAGGMLPVQISDTLPLNLAFDVEPTGRLAYTMPEFAEVDSRTLEQIEIIAREAIDEGATPGCHVLVARRGKVVYQKSFGWLTYQNQAAVTNETIYDLASVTKVSATLQTVMFMHERGLIDINKKASFYLPELKNSNKKDFTIKDILTHQAGLWPFLPFWSNTVRDTVQHEYYYSTKQSEDFPYPVADSLFANKHMKDSLWQWIIKAKVINKPDRTPYEYRYSDMGFYILQHLAEKMLNQPMEDFLYQNIYEPLGAHTLGYLPREKFPPTQIAPTENDQLFRKRQLVGYVHDQGAAMHGGIAGHAGLFGTANDLVKLGQMWLNGGHYGGVDIFKPETLQVFTARQYETSRRGLGWDKPALSDWNSPASLLSSPATFGHTGFTGTCIWVDPAFDLIYIFLSNRVYPEMTNNKILNLNIRPRIHDVIYKAIFNYCAEESAGGEVAARN